MSQDDADSATRLEIDWLKAIAGALAAVTSAVLLSSLGAAGTIIGAAIGSLVVTVGSALFSQGLAKSRRGLAKAQSSARQKAGVAEAEVSRAKRAPDTAARESHLDHAGERIAEANRELDAAAAEPVPLGWRERLAALPWKRICLVSLALFVAAIAAITVFELVAGKPVSSFTGGTSGDSGTTISNVGGEQEKGRRDEGPSDSPSPTDTPPTPTSEPTSEPPASTSAPTEAPTSTDSATPAESQPPEQGTVGGASP